MNIPQHPVRTAPQQLADMAVRAPEATRSSGRESAQTSLPPSTFNPQLSTERTIFSPDRVQYATLSADHRARVWSADTGEPLTPPLDHKAATGPVQFSASGRYFFTLHPAHAIFVWELRPPGEPPVLLRPGPPRTMAETGRDGTVIVTRDPNSPIRVRALSGASEVSLHPSSLKEIPVQAWFDQSGEYIILENEKRRAQIWDAATGLPVTPKFPSHPATNETGYLTVNFPQSEIQNPKSEIEGLRVPPSAFRVQAELLSGSRLDGTGGWKPLELGEILARWNELKQPAIEIRFNE